MFSSSSVGQIRNWLIFYDVKKADKHDVENWIDIMERQLNSLSQFKGLFDFESTVYSKIEMLGFQRFAFKLVLGSFGAYTRPIWTGIFLNFK